MASSLSVRRSGLMFTLMALCAVLLSMMAVPSARADDQLTSYTADMKVLQDGTVKVSATLEAKGSFPETVTQRFATRESLTGNRERVFSIRDVKATSGKTSLDVNVSESGDYVVVSVPTKGLTEPVILTYEVVGAAQNEANGDTLVQWRVLQGLSLAVASVDVTMTTDAQSLDIGCVSGPPASPSACSWFGGGTHESPIPTFHDGPRGAGEIVQPSVRYSGSEVKSNETVVELWSLDRAFRPGLVELPTALGLLVLGGLALYGLHRKIGRDATSMDDPTPVAGFKPVGLGSSEFVVFDGVTPGLVGTLLDERVDPVDITATVLDLATRGHLLITELPRESEFAPTDWTFTRRENTTDELAPYEVAVLDAIAPAEATMHVSEIGPRVTAAVPQIQSAMYDEVVSRGWFARRPDSTRNLWHRFGWVFFGVSIVAALVLVAFTTFGIAGLVLVALAFALLFVADEMPARTASGTSVLAGLKALQADLVTHPTDEAITGREYEQLSRVLAYAVVLGGQNRWLDALVQADDDLGTPDPTDLDWYHAPDTWHLQDLPGSLKRFLTSFQGALFTR